MEHLGPELEQIAILERNYRYLENIMEDRPLTFSFVDRKRLDKCIWEATEEVFDISKEMMLDGLKIKDEVRARRAAALVFRTLTCYSQGEIGYHLGVESSTAGLYLKKSKDLMQADLFFSAFILTTAIKAYGKFYPEAKNPRNKKIPNNSPRVSIVIHIIHYS